MIPLFHRGGPFPCGKPALYVRVLPPTHEMPADNVILLDGTQPQRGDYLLCGSCDGPIVSDWLFASPEAQPITVF